MARLFLYSLFLICLGLLAWAKPSVTTAKGIGGEALGSAPLTMPGQCRPGKTSPEAHDSRWRPGTVVRVYYMRGDFSAEEAAALTRGVENWNRALNGIGSQVSFLLGGETDVEAPEGTSITVRRGAPKTKERVGEIKLHSITKGRAHMLMVVSPKVTNPNALTSLMTHELGHTVGLADCYECQRGTTAMSAFRGANKGNDVYEPSECDRYVVATGYMNRTGGQNAGLVRLESK